MKNKIGIAIAAGFLAAGAAISALKIEIYSPILSGIFAAGLSLLLATLFRHFKFGEGAEHDERTRKIMRRAMTGSWFATLILAAALMLADNFGVLMIDVQQALSAVFFGMIIIFSALNWYFGRKEDDE